MRVRAMLAGVLVVLMLTGAFVSPVCQAGCGIGVNGDPAAMNRVQMAGMGQAGMMEHCAMCASRPVVSSQLAPCVHEIAAGVVAAAGVQAPASVQVVWERVAGSSAPAHATRFVVDETPPLRCPVLLHTVLRV
jgi:hypothetical protein